MERRYSFISFASLILAGMFISNLAVGGRVDSSNLVESSRHSEAVTQSGWTIQCPDCPPTMKNMTDRSLHLDSADHGHIAFGSDHLYYAWYDGAHWQHQMVDKAMDVGEYAALDLDQDEYPHISYYDAINGDLKYAYQDISGWQIETVDGIGDVGMYTSLALDADGYPHISYYDATNGDLKYAYLDISGWHFDTIDDLGDVGMYTSVALDVDGYPHISYHDATNGKLKYAYQDISGWQILNFDDGGDVGMYTSVALDVAGYPHISYYDATNGDLKFAFQDGIGWHTGTVDDGGDVGMYTSVALDGDGYPHISYYDSTNGNLKYAFKDGTGWHPETVFDDEYDVGQYNSLALDASGYPHISYSDDYEGEKWLQYAYRDTGGWQNDVVAYEGEVGEYNAIALDSEGYPFISYLDEYDAEPWGLKLAYQDANGWHTEIVDDGYSTVCQAGYGTSIAIDPDGYPHISYYSFCTVPYPEQFKLSYAYKDEMGWHIARNVDSPAGDILLPTETSIKLDDDGFPHISYSDGVDYDLKYAYNDETGWHIDIVDWEGDVGRHSSLELDGSGFPHISYFDDTNESVKYAWWDVDDSSWYSETVDTGLGSRGGYTSLELDANGNPNIGYNDYTDESLKFAVRENSSWTIETVPSGGCHWRSLSMALDSNDYPHYSYKSQQNLLYAKMDAAGWYTETVESDGNLAWFNSITLDSDGNPRIAYNDYTNLDLKFAEYSPVAPTQVLITGPQTGFLGITHTFTATVSPISTTLPIQYVWQVNETPPITHTGDIQDVINLSWEQPGTQHLAVTASNQSGAVTDTHSITTTDVPVAGLTATNDSPTPLGTSTVLSATISAGTNVSYTWDFGDETFSSGIVVTHTYLSAGVFTATVAASNSANTLTATTVVSIMEPMEYLYLPLILKGQVVGGNNRAKVLTSEVLVSITIIVPSVTLVLAGFGVGVRRWKYRKK